MEGNKKSKNFIIGRISNPVKHPHKFPLNFCSESRLPSDYSKSLAPHAAPLLSSLASGR